MIFGGRIVAVCGIVRDMKRYAYILVLVTGIALLAVSGKPTVELLVEKEDFCRDIVPAESENADYVSVHMHKPVGIGAIWQRDAEKYLDSGKTEWGSKMKVEPLPMMSPPPALPDVERGESNWLLDGGADKKGLDISEGWGWLGKDVLKRRSDNEVNAGAADNYGEDRGWRPYTIPGASSDSYDTSANDPYRALYDLVDGK